MNNFNRTLFVIALFIGAAPLYAGEGTLVPTTGGDVHYHTHNHNEQPPQTWGQFGVSLAMNPKTWVVGGALGTVGWLGWRRRQARLRAEENEARLRNVEGAVAENGPIRTGLAAVVAAVAEGGAIRQAIAANGEAIYANAEALSRLGIVRERDHDDVIRRITTVVEAINHKDTGLGAIAGDVAALRRDNNRVFERLNVVVEDAAATREAALAAQTSSAAAQAAAEAARDGVAGLRDGFATATENLATAADFAALAGRVDGMANDMAALRTMLERQQTLVFPAWNNSLLGTLRMVSRPSSLAAPGDATFASGGDATDDDAEAGGKK